MARMTGFVFQDEYLVRLAKLSDQEVGRLIRALSEYHATGEAKELAGRESVAFDFIKADIDRIDGQYAEKCETNRRSRLGKSSSNDNERQRTSTNVDERAQRKDKDKDIKDDDNNARAREIELPEHVDIPVDHQASDIPEWVDLLTMYKIDLTPAAWEELRQMQEDGAGSDLICWAIERAVDANAKNWNYISRVIDRCVAAGIKTASQAEEMRKKTREEKQKQQTVQKPAYNPQPQQPKKVSAQMYTQREYSDDFMNGFVDDALAEARRLKAQRARESA